MVVSNSESIPNNNLNLNNYISCEEEGMMGSKLLDSVYTMSTGTANNNRYTLSSGTCSNILYSPDETTTPMSNNLCGCNIVNMDNRKIKCPPNTFLRKILPQNKKGVCCKPCMDNYNISTDSRICRPITKSTSNKMVCPDSSYITGIDMNLKDPMITCCKPKVTKIQTEVEAEQQDDLQNLCANVGLNENCNQSDLDKVTNFCTTLGVTPCKIQDLDTIEEKCGNYGMRYYSRKDDKYMNTDSPIECHNSNFEKLDTMCEKYGLDICSVYGIQDYKDDEFATLEVAVKGPDTGSDIGSDVRESQEDQEDYQNYLTSGQLLGSWSDYTVLGSLFCIVIIFFIGMVNLKRR